MSWTTRGSSFHLSDTVGRIPDGTYVKLDRDQVVPVQWGSGYQVADTDWRKPSSAYSTTDVDRVNDLVRDIDADAHGSGYVGVWTDEDGRVYVERSYHVDPLYVAEIVARHWNQKAIFDWSADESLTIQ